MIDAVLFDLGDTLLHFHAGSPTEVVSVAGTHAYDTLCADGIAVPPLAKYLKILRRTFVYAYIRSRIIRREVQMVETVARAHRKLGIHLDDEQTQDIVYGTLPAVEKLFHKDDQANSVVAALHESGYKLGIVSNTWLPRIAVDSCLREEGLLDYFPTRIYSSMVRVMKPSRRIYELALDHMGVSASRALFIGDRVDNDVKGPASLGMETVLVLHHRPQPRLNVRGSHVITGLDELPPLLRSLGSR